MKGHFPTFLVWPCTSEVILYYGLNATSAIKLFFFIIQCALYVYLCSLCPLNAIIILQMLVLSVGTTSRTFSMARAVLGNFTHFI